MKTLSRLTVVCLLVFATVGLCAGFAEADQWTYPSAEEIQSDPEAYDGHQILVFGTVTAVDHANSLLAVSFGSDPEVELTVENAPPSITDSVEQGAAIQAYGRLSESSTVLVADEVVVDYRNATDSLYVYLTSILGGLLAAGVFLWYWRPDWRRLRFIPRGGR